MNAVLRGGFTLIELLVVIAIITILAGLTAVAVPRALETARMTDVDADFHAIATILQQYYTDHSTYPPGYGYLLFKQRSGEPDRYNHHPYTFDTGIEGVTKLYDRFSQDFDTNNDDVLQRLEFLPVEMLPPDPSDPYLILDPGLLAALPYPGGGGLEAFDTNKKRGNSPRPYVYIPYNTRDIKRMKRVINDPANDSIRNELYLGRWHEDYIPDGSASQIPPPEYNAFVLISVGPLEDTRGVITPAEDENAWLSATGEDPRLYYYVLGMRAAYLATRDLNENALLDFDYRARIRQGERAPWPEMPDGRYEYAAPMIYTYAGASE